MEYDILLSLDQLFDYPNFNQDLCVLVKTDSDTLEVSNSCRGMLRKCVFMLS